MYTYKQFFINGEWVDPVEPLDLEVINPATELPIGTISLGGNSDVDRAVAAAKAAFDSYSQTSIKDRIALLTNILAIYQTRVADIANAITLEMGAPKKLSQAAQATAPIAHLMNTIETLKAYAFETTQGTTLLRKEPIGVCGLITPWNWPINQVACKVFPALATGCTMVLKPSEIAPFDACLLAEILEEAGVPKGVFNLVNGDGVGVGHAMTCHPDIDMISFTGSTRAGVAIAKNAADSIKRVTQELGGKSANIILDDVDFDAVIKSAVRSCFNNSGQSCNAPTRLLVPENKMADVIRIARETAEKTKPGDPNAEDTIIGPVVSLVQWNKIQHLIDKGIEEGADLIAGGPGKPAGLETGYYVKPTVFANVKNDMTIAREEIFGPVLSILSYKDENEAIKIANDTLYGLSGYVSSADKRRAIDVAKKMRVGNVHVNGAGPDFSAPFGGYKQSGNGREWGQYGFEDFLEIKAILGGADV